MLDMVEDELRLHDFARSKELHILRREPGSFIEPSKCFFEPLLIAEA